MDIVQGYSGALNSANRAAITRCHTEADAGTRVDTNLAGPYTQPWQKYSTTRHGRTRKTGRCCRRHVAEGVVLEGVTE